MATPKIEVGKGDVGRLRGGGKGAKADGRVTARQKQVSGQRGGRFGKGVQREGNHQKKWDWSCSEMLDDTKPVAEALKNIGRRESQCEKDLPDADGGERQGVGAQRGHGEHNDAPGKHLREVQRSWQRDA